jgi:hypothetical protein
MNEEPLRRTAAPQAWANVRVGIVVRFEPERGLGLVAELAPPAGAPAPGGSPGRRGASYPFHSTAIADGTRKIASDTVVAFLLGPSHGGVLEARELHPLLPSKLSRGSAGG